MICITTIIIITFSIIVILMLNMSILSFVSSLLLLSEASNMPAYIQVLDAALKKKGIGEGLIELPGPFKSALRRLGAAAAPSQATEEE